MASYFFELCCAGKRRNHASQQIKFSPAEVVEVNFDEVEHDKDESLSPSRYNRKSIVCRSSEVTSLRGTSGHNGESVFPAARDRSSRKTVVIERVVETTRSLRPIDISALTMVAKDDLGMLEQPAVPKFKGAIVQIFVRTEPYGGSDKSSNGHRYDSIAFANGLISAGMSCQLIHYIHEEHDRFFEVCKMFDFIVLNCTSREIKADGGSRHKFDNGMRELQKLKIQVWPSLDEDEHSNISTLCSPATCDDDSPNACYADIPADDLAQASRFGCTWGTKTLSIMSEWSGETGKEVAAAGDFGLPPPVA